MVAVYMSVHLSAHHSKRGVTAEPHSLYTDFIWSDYMY